MYYPTVTGMAGIDDQEEPIDSGDEEISAITDNFSSQNNNENSSRLPTSTSRSPSPRPDSPNFSGKWRLSTSENFDPFMRDCNVNYFKRQAAKIISSEHHITQEGDSMSVDVVATGGGKHQVNFTLCHLRLWFLTCVMSSGNFWESITQINLCIEFKHVISAIRGGGQNVLIGFKN